MKRKSRIHPRYTTSDSVRTWVGADDDLLDLLNSPHARPRLGGEDATHARQVLLKLVYLLKQVLHYLSGSVKVPEGEMEETPDGRFPRSLRLLNELLARYPIVRRIEFEEISGNGDTGWSIAEVGTQPPVENDVVRLALEFARSGILERLQRCVCGRWYYARRKDQISCGHAACRQKLYSKTDEFRASRRDYMQYRYAMNFNRDWIRLPNYKKPKFREWLRHCKPTAKQWLEIWKEQHRKAATHGTR